MYRSCIFVTLLVLGGCGRAQSPTTEVVVSAAISISEAMQHAAFEFEVASGTTVTLNIGGSDTLATQLIAGANVDLFGNLFPGSRIARGRILLKILTIFPGRRAFGLGEVFQATETEALEKQGCRMVEKGPPKAGSLTGDPDEVAVEEGLDGR